MGAACSPWSSPEVEYFVYENIHVNITNGTEALYESDYSYESDYQFLAKHASHNFCRGMSYLGPTCFAVEDGVAMPNQCNVPYCPMKIQPND